MTEMETGLSRSRASLRVEPATVVIASLKSPERGVMETAEVGEWSVSPGVASVAGVGAW